MDLVWQSLDRIDDTDDLRFEGDPADLIVARLALFQLAARPVWQQQAACRGRGVNQWFPDRGESVEPAKQVCAICPVAEECAEAGRGETNGIWGGLSGRQRRQQRRVSPMGDTEAA